MKNNNNYSLQKGYSKVKFVVVKQPDSYKQTLHTKINPGKTITTKNF